MMKKPATLKEIANRAGVGVAAVSVVLNGAKSGTRVSAGTRQAILDAAQELNYRPNGLARSLRNQRTGIVGFFSGYRCIDPRNQYIAEVLSGLQSGCVRKNLDLLLYTEHDDLTPEQIVQNISDGRLDGLVVTARPDHPVIPLLDRAHIPVVAIADPLPGIPSVLADSNEGGREQARHLHRKGHRRVLYLPSDFPFLSVMDRYVGFCNEAERLGIEVVVGRPIHGSHPELGEIEERLNLILPEEDLAVLRGDSPATAIVAWDDIPAHRVASQLASLGYRIPEDVAIVGYNGCVHGVEPRWKLTTIRAPWRHIAETAIETLIAAFDGQAVPATKVIPIEFIQGATS
jgi:DNA-binding LacI/PurR family transcriptional regulator